MLKSAEAPIVRENNPNAYSFSPKNVIVQFIGHDAMNCVV